MPKNILTPLEERFWPKVKVGNIDECWEWQANLNVWGYGQISAGRYEDGGLLAHRVSWELAYGKIPNGLHVLHKCDNRKCVNPNHLFLGTHQDNMRDRDEKGRLPTGDRHWSRQHPEKVRRGEQNNKAKLVANDVLYIRHLHDLKIVTNEYIAKMYRVSPRLIGYIVNRDIWKQI